MRLLKFLSFLLIIALVCSALLGRGQPFLALFLALWALLAYALVKATGADRVGR